MELVGAGAAHRVARVVGALRTILDSGEATKREPGRLRRVTPPATALNVEREV